MASNGDRGDYGGDEEPTPAEPRQRISPAAREFASLALEFNHVSVCMWNASRMLDATDGDARNALLAKLVVELSTVIDATIKARAALVVKKAESET